MLSRWSGMFAAAIATFYAILSPNAVARPVSGEEASLAAMNFAVRTAKSFVAEETGTGPERLETLRSDSGNDLGYLVKIKDGPVVIVAAETRVRPIIAFSDSPDADLSEDNPALSLFREDLETRMRVAELEPGPNGKKTVNDGDAAQRSAECELEWQELLSDGGTGKENAGRISSIGDIRVPALMSSTWGQSTVGSLNTWNYYTPNNWVCGCVATAMAQLMRFHLHPSGTVSSFSRTCLEGNTFVKHTAYGGTYQWSNMPLSPSSSSVTLAQRQAMGKLTYDCGVSVCMEWTSGGSGAYGSLPAASLRTYFGYSSACLYQSTTSGSTISDSAIKNAAFASMDAGYPVLFGVAGHYVVGDGYGFSGTTPYTHINYGWSGTGNGYWYNLPTMSVPENDYSSTYVQSVCYNVFPTRTGSVLSGRVLSSSGSPVSGAAVTAKLGSSTYSATSDSRGIYAIIVPSSGTYSVSASSSGSVSATKSVSIASCVSGTYSHDPDTDSFSYGTTGTIGNSWGNELTLSSATGAKPDLSFYQPSGWPAAAYLSSSTGSTTAKTSFTTSDAIWLNFAVANVTDVDATTDFKRSVVLKDSSGSTVASYYFNTAGGLESHTYMTVVDDDLAANLPAGTYTATITIDPENSVSESDESNNVLSLTFTVTPGQNPGNHTLNDAVDNYAMTITTGGNASWSYHTAESFDGVDAARSGNISHGQTTWMEASGVSGEGIISFRWKVSSELGWDKAQFSMDGNLIWTWSGTENGWHYEAMRLGSGAHTFRWTYSKDSSDLFDIGSDCLLVDQVKWTAGSPLYPVYRFYSKTYRGHFYTMDEDEMSTVVNTNPNWKYEGVAYFAYPTQVSGTTGLYRFYSTNYRGHFYTTDYDEYWTVRYTNPNWRYEGIAYFVRPSAGTGAKPVYRFWSKGYRHHFYTMDYNEYWTVRTTNPNWNYEGIAFYAWETPDALSAANSAAAEAESGASFGGDAEEDAAGSGGAKAAADGGGNAVPVGGTEGVFPVGAWTVEVRFDAPDAEEIAEAEARPFEGPVAVPELEVALPEGTVSAAVWSATAGTVSEEEDPGRAATVRPAAMDDWTWVRAFDADGAETVSLWLRLLP